MLLSNYTFEKERERRSTTFTPGCQYGVNTLCVWLPTSRCSRGALSPLALGREHSLWRCICSFEFFVSWETPHRQVYKTIATAKNDKMKYSSHFSWRRGAYKFTSSKVSLTTAIHQTMQPHQSESIRNYSPSKLHWKALICYQSLLLFSSILKDWKQKSNNVTVIVKCNFYWDGWEPICHNICF